MNFLCSSFKIYLVKYSISKFEMAGDKSKDFTRLQRWAILPSKINGIWILQSKYYMTAESDVILVPKIVLQFLLSQDCWIFLTNHSFLNRSTCFSHKHSQLTRNFDCANKSLAQSDFTVWHFWINSIHCRDYCGGQISAKHWRLVKSLLLTPKVSNLGITNFTR